MAKTSGVIAIIVALIMMMIVTASAIVFSSVITRQRRATQEILITERAFYASSSAFEHALYVRAKQNQDALGDNQVTGNLDYAGKEATYTGEAYLTPEDDICALGVGEFSGLVRKLAVGTTQCTF